MWRKVLAHEWLVLLASLVIVLLWLWLDARPPHEYYTAEGRRLTTYEALVFLLESFGDER